MPDIRLDTTDVLFYQRAPITARVLDDDLRKLLRAAGVDEDISDDDLFFFDALFSNNLRDSYHTRMDESTLRNYMNDANTGVALLDSHGGGWLSGARQPLGYSLKSWREIKPDGIPEFPGEERIDVYGTFYVARGVNPGAGIDTDSFIKSVKARTTRDVSVGFKGGEFICSICGRDLWDWDCSHIPGVEYEFDEGERTAVAFAWIRGANLSEVSSVFDGATPGAMIRKVELEAEAGRLRPDVADVLARRYRIHVPVRRAFVVPAHIGGKRMTGKREEAVIEQEELDEVDLTGSIVDADDPPDVTEEADVTEGDADVEEVDVDEEDVEEVVEDADIEAARAALQAVGIKARSVAAGIRDMAAKMELLQKRAAEGEQYRADLIEACIREGIRASGHAFSEATYRRMLEKAELDDIKDVYRELRQRATARFTEQPKVRATREKPPAGEENEGEGAELMPSLIPNSALYG